jgi:hypothetical protein
MTGLGEELRNAALAAVRRGWRVFPCKHDSKVPLIRKWQERATWDERQVSEWWDGVKLYNPAALTGYPGPDVLDVDVRPDGDGWAAYRALKEAGLLAGAWRIDRTPTGGGAHVFFAGSKQRSGAIHGAHIEFKSTRAAIMLPPSWVGYGCYEVIEERPPTGVTFNWEAAKRLLCPEPAYRAPRPGRQQHGRRQRHLVTWLKAQFEGNRNDGLFWAACRAAEAGDDDTVAELADVALAAGLDGSAVESTIESAYRETGIGR